MQFKNNHKEISFDIKYFIFIILLFYMEKNNKEILELVVLGSFLCKYYVTEDRGHICM